VAVDRSKRQRDVREIALEDPEKPIPEIVYSKNAADDTVQGTQISAVLEKLIAALPAKLRAPLVLSALEEMSPREVAETLGINEAAVRSRVFRARQMLKEKLAQRMSKG
jgi:RNA polymerase sigma-70 factor (ECF subfamily)